MIVFIGDGLILILAVVFLVGGYTVGQHIASFLIDYGTAIIIILTIIIIAVYLLSIISGEKRERVSTIFCSVGFTITDISKLIALYIFLMSWAYDYAYFSSAINSIVSIFIFPLCISFFSAVSIVPSYLLRSKILDDVTSQIISSVLAVLVDAVFSFIFIFLLRYLISECLMESYSRILSNGWWEMFLHICN